MSRSLQVGSKKIFFDLSLIPPLNLELCYFFISGQWEDDNEDVQRNQIYGQKAELLPTVKVHQL